MEGIRILHTFTDQWTPLLFILFLVLSVLLVGLTIYLSYIAIKNRTDKRLYAIAIGCLLATALCFLGLYCNQGTGGEYYKITIDRSVSYLDFIENYEVISVEGEIYTVKFIGDKNSSIDEAPTPTEDEWVEPTYETETNDETWDPNAVG